jgi:predicted O-methyltransferase YrrM
MVTGTEVSVGLIAGAEGSSRLELWGRLTNRFQAKTFLELGVYRGTFAEGILRNCPTISRYYMLDPWKHLDAWNKPANVEQASFDDIYARAMARTDFARDRRIVLRGTTLDMIDQVPSESLDIAYIDGDHTLRGISIDLIRTYPKVRPGGIIGGDDFTPTIWQHAENFEPTLVCPFAAYFAESQGAPLVILPYHQFAIVKPAEPGRHFQVIDTTHSYGSLALLPRMRHPR